MLPENNSAKVLMVSILKWLNVHLRPKKKKRYEDGKIILKLTFDKTEIIQQ